MSASVSRRHLLQSGLVGAAGLCLAGRLGRRAWAGAPAAPRAARAKSVIQIWMWGGPCHLDTFDPKPEAGSEFTGPLGKPIETNVSGLRISELLPLLAQQADRYSLVRSVTHGSNAHETASYLMQTGREAGERVVYPGAGAVVARLRAVEGGSPSTLPPYIVLTEPQGRFDEAGFLGTRYRPFATGGDPSQPRFQVEGIVAAGVTDEQQRQRRDLLRRLDALRRALPGDPALKALLSSEEQAYDMILGDGAKVFDLGQEPEALRERYGRSKFGQSCLVARRLVERGVPYVTINYAGWDTHKEHFVQMRRKLPELDKGLATLLADLAERGLLESTVVWCGGEFGRTPRVQWEAPWNGGRGHWGRAFSALLAGGGFQGGRVVGATDGRGEEVKDRPVRPRDLVASIYALLGVDGDARLPHPQGLDTRVLPPVAEDVGASALLHEIM